MTFSGQPQYGSNPQADTYEKAVINWIKKDNVAQYGEADWKNEVKRLSGLSLEQAQKVAAEDARITFFFYTRQRMNLGPKGNFSPGDAVFFSGQPWYGSAPQADAYEKVTTNLDTTSNIDLGPGSNLTITVGDKQVFLLNSEDQIKLQFYVETGIRLPTSDSEMRMLLKYTSTEETQKFSNLVNVYSQIYQHCTHFRSKVYPQSVALASDIYAYAIKVPDYYDDILATFQEYVDKKITKEAAQADIKDLVGSLQADVAENIKKVDAVHAAIQQFDTDTVADKGRLDVAVEAYTKEYSLNENSIKLETDAIDNLKAEIANIQAEYQQDVIIAATTPAYGWVPFLGWIIAPIIAGVYGDRAIKLKDKIIAKQAELAQEEADKLKKIMLKSSLTLANDSLAGVSEKAKAALEALAKIKTVWTNLDAALKRVPIGLTDIEAKESLRGLKRAIASAKTEWEGIKELAKIYKETAYIDVKEAKDVANSQLYK